MLVRARSRIISNTLTLPLIARLDSDFTLGTIGSAEIAGMVSIFGLHVSLLLNCTGAQNGAGDRFWPFHRFMTIPGVLDTYDDSILHGWCQTNHWLWSS